MRKLMSAGMLAVAVLMGSASVSHAKWLLQTCMGGDASRTIENITCQLWPDAYENQGDCYVAGEAWRHAVRSWGGEEGRHYRANLPAEFCVPRPDSIEPGGYANPSK